MRSNLSVGMPIDLVCYERDSLKVSIRHRFEQGDAYFTALSKEWREGVRAVFRRLPAVPLLLPTTSFHVPAPPLRPPSEPSL
jgi:predicted proteasome-type protease